MNDGNPGQHAPPPPKGECEGLAVSVLLPVFSGERYIEAALDSIAHQSLRAIEIVVVDDGSTDGTLGILRRKAADDSRIKLFPRRNAGLVAALNFGLSQCRAPLVARMDADDIAEPNRLSRQVATFATNPRLVLLGGQTTLIDQDDNETGTGRFPVGMQVCAERLMLSSCFNHPSVMMRRDAVERAGGYRDAFRHAEDYDLWLRLAEFGAVDNLPIPVLKYRVHGGSVTANKAPEQAGKSALALLLTERRRNGLAETSLPAATAEASLQELLDGINADVRERDLGHLLYWRFMALNGGLRQPALLQLFRQQIPSLAAEARGLGEARSFAFMMLRAARAAIAARAPATAAICVARSLSTAPASSISEIVATLSKLMKDF